MVARSILFAFALLSASPVLADGATEVPEGSQATLFALGLLGVIVGRRASMRSDKDDPEQD